MLFNSFAFALFFPVAFALRWAAERFGGVRARNAVLLAASYYFYGCWDWRFLGLIIGSSVVDFVAAQAMSRPDA
ncbi:MAG: MBOAT family protein, partial [Myxococcales bacterium]|nr:MBOAT family protein [Myxococcales bacterium]